MITPLNTLGRGVVFSFALFLACLSARTASAAVQVKLNQLGFYPEGNKIAVAVGATTDSFEVVRLSDSSVAFSGELGGAATWSASDEVARIADFSTLQSGGSYIVRCAGCDDSYPFTVTGRVNLALAKGALKAFYFNRCSFALTEPFAGVYARSAGHPDTAVEVHPSAASDARPAGSSISSPGGWYDAGDYGKYIVNSGISTYTLFSAYEAFPEFFDTLNLAIPESDNSIPDLLDEALYNFRWMLTMQDPEDGGVYHKMTTAAFSGNEMPEAVGATRYLVAKSTAATLDFAAVCAVAARLFAKFETQLPGFADSCLDASLRAWEWARANDAVLFQNRSLGDPAISTGEYGDRRISDELLWASTELFIATGRDSFFTVAFPRGELSGVSSIPAWGNVGTLALYSLFLSGKEFSNLTAEEISSALADLADQTLEIIAENPYHVGVGNRDFGWGSNSNAANRGMSLLLAYLDSGNDAYRAAAIDMIDYLLGRNPTGYSFVTGFGDHTPLYIHHRPSAADGIAAPIPGFLAGGPNPSMQDTGECGYGSYPSSLPALAYYDHTCSYASNEIAINWNAPFAFLSGGISALYGTDTLSAVKRSGKKKALARPGTIRQRHGHLEISVGTTGSYLTTIATLKGAVLYRKKHSSPTNIVTAWPLQAVVVTVRHLGAGSIVARSMTVAGYR